MREQLIQYVSLLFAGANGCEDIKQEILQNTLDRYDDLIAEGKSPEAAYRLAITGIGDINEILGSTPQNPSHPTPAAEEADTPERKQKRAVAIAFFILSPVPLFILSEFGLDTLGLCLTLALVAAGVALMSLNSKAEPANPSGPYEFNRAETPMTPQQELNKSIGKMIGAIGLAAYLIISFMTGAWHITWVIFPIIGAVKGLVRALMGDDSRSNLHKGLSSMIWAIGLAVYFLLSFSTGAWYITWVLFPIIAAVQGLVKAILDLKEAE